MVQVAPFQDSIRVFSPSSVLVWDSPTAVQAVAEVHEMPLRVDAGLPPRFGLGTMLQVSDEARAVGAAARAGAADEAATVTAAQASTAAEVRRRTVGLTFRCPDGRQGRM